MPKTIFLPNPTEFVIDGLVEFPCGTPPLNQELVRLWKIAFALPIRSDASSVHFHSWRDNGHFTMIANGMRLGMIRRPIRIGS